MRNRLLVATLTSSLLVFADAPARAARPPQIVLTTSARSAPIPVTRLEGEEAISSLFHFTVEVTAEPVPFDALGGAAGVNVLMGDGSVRHISGIVFGITEISRERGTAHRVEIVPKLRLLTRRAQSRIFQRMSVPEIVGAVLQEGGIDFETNLAGIYSPREFTAQYRESDFAFVSRLLEEEGIYYFFRHSAGGHTLVLADAPGGHLALPGGANEIVFEDRRGTGGSIVEWEKKQELRSGKYTLRDYHFQTPQRTYEFSGTIREEVRAGEVTHRLAIPGTEDLEVYDYPGGYAQRFDGVSPSGSELEAEGRRTVAVRIEEEAASAVTIAGAGSAAQLVAGHRFTLAGHPTAGGEYVVTSVHHRAAGPGEGVVPEYTNAFTCIPAGLPFRPARVTPRPVIGGTQTATVTGTAGEEVFTDEHGRVKVQFHWDREGASDENSSRWVRVGALHAGQQSGWHAVPEVGDEVIVAFLEGDPDRPIIVGSLFNLHNPPPGGEPRPPDID